MSNLGDKDGETGGIDTEWLKEHAAATHPIPVAWTSFHILLQIFYIAFMIHEYGGDAQDFTWEHFVYSQLALNVYSWVMANYVFPKVPTILGIPFFLFAFVPGILVCFIPFLATDMGTNFARNVPMWVLMLWACLRIQFESCVQMHKNYGVRGISMWLLWPTQKTSEKYTMTYAGNTRFAFDITRPARGGNPDASGSFFIGLPCFLVTYLVSPKGEKDDETWLGVLNLIVQSILLVNLCWGPFVHIVGGMPGMTAANPLFNNGNPRKELQMHGMFRGMLGVIIVPIASFAILHTLIFYRRFGMLH